MSASDYLFSFLLLKNNKAGRAILKEAIPIIFDGIAIFEEMRKDKKRREDDIRFGDSRDTCISFIL